MQSSYNILLALYEVLNIPELDKVYLNKASAKLQGWFIVINTINNPNQYLQNGFGNVNIYGPNIGEQLPDGAGFKERLDIILPLLDDVTKVTANGTFHFQVDDEKGPFEDQDRDGMSYQNIRFEYQTL